MKATGLVLAALLLSPPVFAQNEAPPPPDSVYGRANEHFRRGHELLLQKNCAAADSEFAEATRLNPRFGLAYYWLGVCELQQGRPQDALRDLRLAKANTMDARALEMIQRPLSFLEASQSAARQEAVSADNRSALARFFGSGPAPLVLPIVGAFLLLFFAVSRRGERDAASPGSGQPPSATLTETPAPPADLAALRRLTAGWTPELELSTTTVPRGARFAAYKQLLVMLAIIVFGAGIVVVPQGYAIFRQHVIQSRGVAGTGAFERGYNAWHSGRHGSYWVHHVVFTFSPEPARRWRADRVVGRETSYQPGQALPIHYLRDKPDWVALDDDLGYLDRQMIGFYAAGGTAALILLIAALAMAPQLKKQRDLVRRGTAAAAWVERVDLRPKGAASAFVRFEAGGQSRRVECSFSQQYLESPLRAGDVVTVLYDPQDSSSAAIYRAGPFRAETAG